MRIDKKNRQAGFTILELMIASMVFSVVLLLCASAIVQVGKMYYKSTLVIRATDTARAVSDDVAQAIQFGAAGTTGFFAKSPPGTVQAYCLGSIRYTYAPSSASLGTATGQIRHVLWKDRSRPTGCSALDLTQPNPGGLSGQELLGNDMRLSRFEIIQGTNPITGQPDPSAIWTVNVTVAYGSTTDLFTDTTYMTCVSSLVGGRFCAVSSVNTNVTKRL